MPYSSAEGDSYVPPVPAAAAPLANRLHGATCGDGGRDGQATQAAGLSRAVSCGCLPVIFEVCCNVSSLPLSAAPIVRMAIARIRALPLGGTGADDALGRSNAPCYMTKKLGIFR